MVFILDYSRLVGAAMHIHRPGHDADNLYGEMVHVIPAHLSTGIGQAIGKTFAGRIQQNSRRLHLITGHANDARLLSDDLPGFVPIDDTVNAPLRIMAYALRHGFGS